MPRSANPIRVAVIKAPASKAADSESPVSIYMYLAGLLVSLSGMYAVTYDMADTNFALVLHGLIICGYGVSYWLRNRRIDLKQYQAPLLVVFATVMYFVASTAPDLSTSFSSNGLARPYQIQIVIIWIAVLQSFTLCTDSAILFACVPSMALIGIMSSGTPDTEVQCAFVVFLAATTFLMVHENHLRTRTSLALRTRSVSTNENRLFGGELILVTCCIAGTMLLATVVATPIQVIGKALIPSNGQDALKAMQNKVNPASSNILVEENSSVDIGTGPVTQTDTPLLEVTASEKLPYFRGATYDYYTGRRFEDRISEHNSTQIGPHIAAELNSAGSARDLNTTLTPGANENEYDLAPGLLDVDGGRMEGATTVKQSVKVRSASVKNLYGAPAFSSIYSEYPQLLVSKSGSVSVQTPMVLGQVYQITSLVPNRSDTNALRRSSTNYPAEIIRIYLQVTDQGKSRSQRLQQYADNAVAGKTNPYDKAVAISDAIAKSCTYSIQAPAIPADEDVVEGFLFDVKQGYCKSFAAALTVLCRYEGVPARYVSGFIRGDRQSDDSVVLLDKHKHAWVEVYFTNIGWIAFDATETAQDYTPGSGAPSRGSTSPLKWLFSHGPVPPAIAIVVIFLLAYVLNTEVLNKYRKSSLQKAEFEPLAAHNMEIVRLYHSACKTLAKVGLERSPHITPDEYNRMVRMQFAGSPEACRIVNDLTELHSKFTYGAAIASQCDVEAGRALLKGLAVYGSSLPRR